MSDILKSKPRLLLVHRDSDALSSMMAGLSSLEVMPLVLSRLEQAFEHIDIPRDGCLVTDHHPLEQNTGVKLIDFQRQFPTIPVIVWTAHCDLPLVTVAFRSGIIDVIHKPAENTLLRSAIEHALKMGADRWLLLQKKNELAAAFSQLMSSERDVLSLLLAGKTNKEISYRLECSQRTVESRRQRILRVMQADSAIELGRVMGQYELLQSLSTLHPWLF